MCPERKRERLWSPTLHKDTKTSDLPLVTTTSTFHHLQYDHLHLRGKYFHKLRLSGPFKIQTIVCILPGLENYFLLLYLKINPIDVTKLPFDALSLASHLGTLSGDVFNIHSFSCREKLRSCDIKMGCGSEARESRAK